MGLTIGGVNLSDTTKYKFRELDEQPNWEIRIKAGCSGSFPIVESNKHVYDVLPIEVICLGSTIDTAMSNRNTLIAEILKPLDRTNPPVYVTRTVLSQTTPDIWTLLAAQPTHIRREWDGLKKIWYRLDLYVFPGQRIP
jgi:hypothetical protein